MKTILLLFGSFFLSLSAVAKPTYELGGTKLNDYIISYPSDADAEEGVEQAEYLKNELKKNLGVSLPIKEDVKPSAANCLRVLNPDSIPTFDYAVNVNSGNVLVMGGCGWAMHRAINTLIEKLKQNNTIQELSFAGTVEGDVLFPRQKDINFRLFDDNIWDYSKDTVPPAWADAGLDCRDFVRAPKFAQLIRAYMPDVICLQEYNEHMDKELYPLLKKYGYKRASNGKEESWPHTPVFYDKSLWKLLKVNYRRYGQSPDTWCNNGSKSFTSAVLRNKVTGQTVAVISTHLWFRSDKTHPGSTYARTSQAALIMAEAEVIKAKYDCPVFVCGDMNCTEDKLPIRLFLDAGCKPCYKIATQYADKKVGHHACFPQTVGSRQNNGKNRKDGSIDHCLLYNGKDTEIKRFECLRPYFSVFLTDHYPNIVDAVLK